MFGPQGEERIELWTCPLPMIEPWERSMIELFGDYKANQYPYPGGLIANPKMYGLAMKEIDRAVNTILKAEADAKR